MNWIRYKKNPVFPAVPEIWMESQTANPDILLFNDKYLMFFRGQQNGHDRIGVATVDKSLFDGKTWNVNPEPVIDVGDSGDWDETHVLDPAAVLVPKHILAGIFKISPNGKLNIDASKDMGKRLNFGWTTCLTYQTDDRKLGFEYFDNLLNEMHEHGMTHLIVMMASHGNYSPKNHGLAWPVKNEKLRPQLDKKAVNAYEETEFLSRIIDKAHVLNIKIYIEIKYLGMRGIKEGYPGFEVLTRKDGRIFPSIPPEGTTDEREAIESLHICCDNKQSHQYMRDKIFDVLTRYKDLDGIVLEHPSYFGNTCNCDGSYA